MFTSCFDALLGLQLPGDGETVVAHGRKLTMARGVPRANEFFSKTQGQTRARARGECRRYGHRETAEILLSVAAMIFVRVDI